MKTTKWGAFGLFLRIARGESQGEIDRQFGGLRGTATAMGLLRRFRESPSGAAGTNRTRRMAGRRGTDRSNCW